MAKTLNLNADTVWAASCAAHRINGGYVKVAVPEGSFTNRELVHQFVKDMSSVLDEDYLLAQKVKAYYQAYTFKILRGMSIGEFNTNAMQIASQETIVSEYQLAIVTCLPESYIKGIARDKISNRIAFATGGRIGSVGDKIKREIEVVKSVYSSNWNIFYITCLTKEDEPVFFSFKTALEVGSIHTITATVKAHTETNTHLNRTKICK